MEELQKQVNTLKIENEELKKDSKPEKAGGSISHDNEVETKQVLECGHGYVPSLNKTYCVKVPQNAHSVNTGTDVWLCDKGFYEKGNECISTGIVNRINFEKRSILSIVSGNVLYPKIEKKGEYYLVAKLFFKDGIFDEALDFVNMAIAVGDDTVAAYELKARIEKDMKELENALNSINIAITKGSNDYLLRAVIEIDPKNESAYFVRGFAKLLTGEKERACIDFHRALSFGEERAAREINDYCVE